MSITTILLGLLGLGIVSLGAALLIGSMADMMGATDDAEDSRAP
jgi:hypothetical protein